MPNTAGGDDDYGDFDDDNSPPTMAILSPGVMSNFSSGRGDPTDELDLDSSEEYGGGFSESTTYSPENYAIFSPASDIHTSNGDRAPVNDPLDLTMGPLDLSLKKRRTVDDVRSSPTCWFAREDRSRRPVVPMVAYGGKGGNKKMPLISVSSLMQERTVPMRMAMKNATSGNVSPTPPPAPVVQRKEVVERPAKRPRPYICQYCGIGFTIRGMA